MAYGNQYYDDLISFFIANIEQSVNIKDVNNNKELAKMLGNIDSLIVQMGDAVTKQTSVGLTDTFFESLEEARKTLKDNGVSVAGGSVFKGGAVKAEFKTMANMNALQQVMMDTMLDLEASFRTARNEGINNILNTVAGIKEDIAKGLLLGTNREKVVSRVKQTITNGGLTGFTTVDGKRLPIDFYARTVVRTKTQTARNKAHIKTYNDAGVRLITVEGGQPTCGRCSAYRGITFDTSGKDSRFPYLDFETSFPLHPNCKCVAIPFVEEYKSPEEIEEAIGRGKKFNPNKDARGNEGKRAYDVRMKKQRVARQEEKDYKRMKDILGDEAPKTIGAFRNMKRNRPEQYRALVLKMRRSDGFYPMKVFKPKPVIASKVAGKEIAEEVAEEVIEREGIRLLKQMQFSDKIMKNVSEKDRKLLLERLEEGQDVPGFDDYIAVFSHVAKDAEVINRKTGAHYSPMYNQVVMDTSDLTRPSMHKGKQWTDDLITFQHEMAHYLAGNAYAEKTTRFSSKLMRPIKVDLSKHHKINDMTLGQTVQKEISDKVKEFQAKTLRAFKEEGRNEKFPITKARRVYLQKVMRGEELQSLAGYYDMYEGAHRGSVRGIIGHGKEYWSAKKEAFETHEYLGAESFAHFAEMYVDKDQAEFLQRELPESHKFFTELIKKSREDLGI